MREGILYTSERVYEFDILEEVFGNLAGKVSGENYMKKKIYIGILLLGVLAIGGVGGLAYKESQIKKEIPQIEDTEKEKRGNKTKSMHFNHSARALSFIMLCVRRLLS